MLIRQPVKMWPNPTWTGRTLNPANTYFLSITGDTFTWVTNTLYDPQEHISSTHFLGYFATHKIEYEKYI